MAEQPPVRVKRSSLPKAGPNSNIVRIVNAEDPGSSSHETLTDYILSAFGTTKTEFERNFVDALVTRKFSLRLLLTYLFLIWYATALLITEFTIARAERLVVRCEIPELEKHFNFSQILDISYKNSIGRARHVVLTEYCKYDDRNYMALVIKYNYSYPLIMDAIRKENKTPTQIPCKSFKISYEEFSATLYSYSRKLSFVQDLKIYCNNNLWNSVFKILRPLGVIIAHVVLGLLGDIYGRKLVFVIASVLHLLGFLLLFYRHIWFYLVSRFLISFGTIGKYMLYTLFLEMCNNTQLLWLGLLIFIVSPLSNFIAYALVYHSENWKYVHAASTSMLVVLPFGIWLINESPRWLMFVGYKTQAWTILDNWRNIVGQSRTVPSGVETVVSKQEILRRLRQYFMQPIFFDRVIMCLLLAFLSSVTIYVEKAVLVNDAYFNKGKFRLVAIIMEMILLLLACFVAIIYGRRKVFFANLCILTVIDGIFFMKLDLLENYSILRITLQLHVVIASIILYMLIFYVIELFPTPFRTTPLGISLASCIFGHAVQEHVGDFLYPQSKAITYMPAFIASVTSTLVVCLLPETRNEGLPDIAREALYLRTVP